MAKENKHINVKMNGKTKKGIAITLASIFGLTAIAGGAYAISKQNGVDWFKPTGNITSSTNNNTTTLQFEELNNKLNSYMAKVSLLESEKANLQKIIEEKETAYNELLADANATTEALVNARKELVQLTLDMEAKQAEVDEQKALIDELNAEILALQTAYDELQELYSNALLEESVFEQLLNGTLTSLKIPDSVTILKSRVLGGDSIKSVDFNNVKTLEAESLINLKYLETLDLKNVETVDSCVFRANSTGYVDNLKTIIGHNLKSLHKDAFAIYYPSLELMDFSGSEGLMMKVEHGYSSAYASCPNFKVFKLPTNLTLNYGSYLGEGFFIHSKYFEVGNLNIVSTNYKFQHNSSKNLETVNLTGNLVMKYDYWSYILSGDKTVTFYVPDELLEQYKTATGWIDYADQIKPVSEMPVGIDTVEYYQTA